jgi:putative DNA primase/helicase
MKARRARVMERAFCIPPALQPYASLPVWVVWRMEMVKGKPTKVPYQPNNPTRRAKSDDSATWSDAATAIKVAERDGFDGVGLQLHNGEIAAFDLDHCRDPNTGTIHPKVEELIERAASYTEITPSKTGLRIIGIYCGLLTKGIKRPVPGANGVSIEAYPASKRYITVTGDHLDGTPEKLADITELMDNTVEELLGNGKAKSETTLDESQGEDEGDLPASLTTRLFIPDEGAAKAHAGYPSRSELAFAFIAEAIRAKIEAKRIVRASLDERHRGHAVYEHCYNNGGEQYVERQIDQARAKVRETSEKLTDLGNARRLIHCHGNDLRYVPTWHGWMSWADGHWRRDEDGAAMRMAKATVEQMHTEAMQTSDENARTSLRAFAIRSQSAQRLAAMVKLAESELEVVACIEKLDADPLLLGVRNGVIDLKDVTFRAARREDYVTKIAGVAFDPKATCPNWLKFLEKIFPADRLRGYLMRATGYLLTGLTDEEVMFVLWGRGSNGKSTFRETLFALMGDYAVGSDASLLITSKRPGGATPDLARLAGRRLVTVNETEQHSQLNEQRVKFITSHDVITARNLFEDPFDFRPSHKTFLTTNYKPIVKGTDDGIWRRIHLLPFTTIIAKGDRDPSYREKKLLPELSGILNWALEGLRAYWSEGLNPPPEVTEATDEYRVEMDIIGSWIEDRCQSLPDAEETTAALHMDYEQWAKREIGFAMSTIAFGRELANRGFTSKKVKRGRGVRGLKLLPPPM